MMITVLPSALSPRLVGAIAAYVSLRHVAVGHGRGGCMMVSLDQVVGLVDALLSLLTEG